MVIAFLSGLLIGVLYFGGLYYSTQSLSGQKSPGLFMAFSLIIRLTILGLGLYYLAQTGYQSVLVGFIGIMLVRFVMIFIVKRAESNSKLERE